MTENTLRNEISSKSELNVYLKLMKEKLDSNEVAAIQVLTALNHVLSSGNIYDLLDKDNKQIAQELWLAVQAKGVKLKNPPVLFSSES